MLGSAALTILAGTDTAVTAGLVMCICVGVVCVEGGGAYRVMCCGTLGWGSIRRVPACGVLVALAGAEDGAE